MAKFNEVLGWLRPNGGYYAVGTEYEGIQFTECEPFTKQEFLAAFEAYDAWVIQQQQEKEAKKEAALAKLSGLGLTIEDIKALGLA